MEIFGRSKKREKRKTKFTCFYCCYPRDATPFSLAKGILFANFRPFSLGKGMLFGNFGERNVKLR